MYAAVAGVVDVAVSLFAAGADPHLRDDRYAHHDFFRYAVLANNFHIVLGVLNFARQSTQFSKNYISSLLNSAIISWAGDD